MNCPKCHAVQPDGTESCSRCGVVFAKLASRTAAEKARSGAACIGPEVLPIPQADNGLVFCGRGIALVIMLWFSWSLIPSSVASNAAGESFMHLVNLPFHEAGHILFRPLGALITSLGGSLGQLLMPLICLFVLWFRTRDAFGAGVCAWWIGENLLDMAPYINDARSLSLPLLGGNVGESSPYGFHDWEFILNETGLLRLDHTLASVAHGLGSLVMLAAIAWCAFWLWRQYGLLRAAGRRG